MSQSASDNTLPPQRILIAACGDIGARLASQLLAARPPSADSPPLQVWGLRRRPELLPANIHRLGGDLSQPQTLGDWPHFDLVVATPVPAAAADKADKAERYRRGYLQAAQGLIRHLQYQKQKPHLFWTSSTAVYAGLPTRPESPEQQVDEATPPTPADKAGEMLLQAEQAMLDSGLPCCILRPAGIYGPGRNALLRRALAAPADAADSTGVGNRIHSEDCAGATAHLALKVLDGQAIAPLYLLSDGHPASRNEVIRWLRQQMRQQGLTPAETPAETPPPANLPKRRGTALPISNRLLLQSGFHLRYADWHSGYSELLEAFVRDDKNRL